MGLRILVVDDSPLALEHATRLLERQGHDVVTLEGWEGATRMVLQGEVDLALVDVHLPTLDGDSIVAALRQTERGKQTPLVLVSEMPEDELRERTVAAGADDWMCKPLTAEMLRAKIRGFFPNED